MTTQRRIRVSRNSNKASGLFTPSIIPYFLALKDDACKQAWGNEVEIMQQLGEKATTDEEIDSDDLNVLVKRTLPLRSKKLSS